jgi:hypothetical protein
MTEFRTVVGAQLCPDISREEIVNACGVDDLHDGVNYVCPRPPCLACPPGFWLAAWGLVLAQWPGCLGLASRGAKPAEEVLGSVGPC